MTNEVLEDGSDKKNFCEETKGFTQERSRYLYNTLNEMNSAPYS